MQFRVEDEVFRMFPNFCRAVVVATGIDNGRPCPELEERLREQQERVRQDAAIDPATHPRLLAWKEAYRQFGSNPNKFTPSIVFLAKQAKAGKTIRSISPAVDAFNLISLKYLVPSGGDDMDRVQGDVTLGRAAGNETFAPIFSPEATSIRMRAKRFMEPKPEELAGAELEEWRFFEDDAGDRNVAIPWITLPAISRSETKKPRRNSAASFAPRRRVTILYLDSERQDASNPQSLKQRPAGVSLSFSSRSCDLAVAELAAKSED